MLFSFTTQAVSAPNLFVGVTTDKTVYKTSDTIAMGLTVLNLDTMPYKATFTSGKKFDFYLYKEKELIWKWSGDKMFAMALTDLSLDPKKPLTFVITLPPLTAPLEPRHYKLVGVLCTKDKEHFSEPMEIEVIK